MPENHDNHMNEWRMMRPFMNHDNHMNEWQMMRPLREQIFTNALTMRKPTTMPMNHE